MKQHVEEFPTKVNSEQPLLSTIRMEKEKLFTFSGENPQTRLPCCSRGASVKAMRRAAQAMFS
ncbi:MAG: hypothetical protein KF893_25830 [Caldilineaceae bacterium]|nr:hypothetical protein [Caldilineaceae bacterium]